MSTDPGTERESKPSPSDSNLALITVETDCDDGREDICIYDRDNEKAWIQINEEFYIKAP